LTLELTHNPRTLNNKHPSMHIIVIKYETHPLMHTIMLKSKAHRCGKIRHIDLVKFTAKLLNIGDMRVMEVYVYVYNPYLWMILYFTITMGINGCILDFTTKCA
jgi:hypothetical protein